MEEIVRELESNQTRYIIYNPEEYKILDIPNETRLRPVWDYVVTNYEFLTSYGDMQILVRASGK
jgi:hypothetical protein